MRRRDPAGDKEARQGFIAGSIVFTVPGALAVLGLATLLPAEEAGLIPVACGLFAFSRCVYWWGYLRSGTLGRAPGVQLSFTVNIGGLALGPVLLAQRLAA